MDLFASNEAIAPGDASEDQAGALFQTSAVDTDRNNVLTASVLLDRPAIDDSKSSVAASMPESSRGAALPSVEAQLPEPPIPAPPPPTSAEPSAPCTTAISTQPITPVARSGSIQPGEVAPPASPQDHTTDTGVLQHQLTKAQAKIRRMKELCVQAKVMELERKEALNLCAAWRQVDDPDEGALQRVIRRMIVQLESLARENEGLKSLQENQAKVATNDMTVEELLHRKSVEASPMRRPCVISASQCNVEIIEDEQIIGGQNDSLGVKQSSAPLITRTAEIADVPQPVSPTAPQQSSGLLQPVPAGGESGVLSSVKSILSSPVLHKNETANLAAAGPSAVAGWIGSTVLPGYSPSPKCHGVCNDAELLRSDVNKLKNENARLREEAEVSRDNLRTMMKLQEEEMAKFKAKSDTLEIALAAERKKNQEWVSNVQFLESQLYLKNMDLERARSNASATSSKISTLEAECKSLQAEIDDAKVLAAQGREVIESLKQEIESQRAIIEAAPVASGCQEANNLICSKEREHAEEGGDVSKTPAESDSSQVSSVTATEPRSFGVARNVCVVDEYLSPSNERADEISGIATCAEQPTDGPVAKAPPPSGSRDEVADRQHIALIRAKDIVIEKLKRRLEYMEGNDEVNIAVKRMAARESAMELEVAQLQAQLTRLSAQNFRLQALENHGVVDHINPADLESVRALLARYVTARQSGNSSLASATLPILCALLKLPKETCSRLLKAENLPQPRS